MYLIMTNMRNLLSLKCNYVYAFNYNHGICRNQLRPIGCNHGGKKYGSGRIGLLFFIAAVRPV